MDTVVISGGGKGDQPVGSPEVKVSVRRRATRQVVAQANQQVAPKWLSLEVSNPSTMGEDQRRRRRNWVDAAGGLPGVFEDDMSRRNVERKLGTTRGSPRRTRTAKASRISCCAVKSRCACEWGGWGRLSDDGPGQHNPDRSEDPWGRATGSLARRCMQCVERPDLDRGRLSGESMHEGWR